MATATSTAPAVTPDTDVETPVTTPVLPDLDPALGQALGNDILLGAAREEKVAKVRAGTDTVGSRAWTMGGYVD